MSHRNATDSPWTDDRIETLQALWKTDTSAREIAGIICAMDGPEITRAAVIGKARRLGVSEVKPVKPPPTEAEKLAKLKARRQRRNELEKRRRREKAQPDPLRRARIFRRQPTKAELREMLTQAVLNTR